MIKELIMFIALAAVSLAVALLFSTMEKAEYLEALTQEIYATS